LAQHGFRVTAVDLSAAALQAAATAASAEGLPPDNPQWLRQDIFELDAHQGHQFSFIYDCQGGFVWGSS
jgi:2-polyprenyl-3-methyl-5-hydroxy-6-metoxy-1,4-benzoquinol methylase